MFQINDQTKKIIFIGITILLFILFIVSNNESTNNKVINQLKESDKKVKASCCGNSENINKIRDMYSEEEEVNIDINQDKPIIINFNTEWCYYSKKFQPIWDDFTKKMKGKNIVVKDVKCDISQNEPICAKYDIEGFPTVKLIKNNKVYEYNGRRTVDDLTNYINKHI
tara:strand:+ start:87 stop:590 length:504 start_codon:yes stop_codon:yes gene_type:complete